MIIDNDVGPLLGKEQRVLPTDPTTSTSNDHYTSVERSH